MTPYLPYLKVLFVVAVAAAGLYSGHAWTENKLAAEMERKNSALRDAGGALRAAANALREQKRANLQRIADAERYARGSASAAQVANAAADTEKARADDFERQMLIAKRRPDCDALLKTNVRQVCGF